MKMTKRETCYVCGRTIKTFLGFGWCSWCANRVVEKR